MFSIVAGAEREVLTVVVQEYSLTFPKQDYDLSGLLASHRALLDILRHFKVDEVKAIGPGFATLFWVGLVRLPWFACLQQYKRSFIGLPIIVKHRQMLPSSTPSLSADARCALVHV
jgi:hypothetical protein